MAKLILATGIDGLDQALQTLLGSAYQVESVSFLHALTVISIEPSDTVIISDSIPMNGGMESLVDIIDKLRRGGVRVVFLGAEKPKDDPMIPALVSRGVYDLLLSDDMTVEDIVDLLHTPATYADVAHWVASKVSSSANSRRPTLTLKKQEEQAKSDQKDVEELHARPSIRVGWKKKKEPDQMKTFKKVVVTGLPGSGVSFIALHLAMSYAQTKHVTLIETTRRPVFRSWLYGTGHDRLRIERMDLQSIRLSKWETDIVVIDADIEDVRRLDEQVDVLVVPPDIVKVEYVKDVHPRLVIVNLVPRELPVELEEFGRVWSDVAISSCSFMQDQALAIVLGKPIEKNNTIFLVDL